MKPSPLTAGDVIAAVRLIRRFSPSIMSTEMAGSIALLDSEAGGFISGLLERATRKTDFDFSASTATVDGGNSESAPIKPDARLIAAAPAMREALQALANTADNADADFAEYRHALRASVRQARAALWLAEGEDR